MLQLQSATTQPQSEPVDYQAGIEAMVLAILQQTNVTIIAQQAQMVAMQIEYLGAQDSSASYAQLTSLYSAYLAEALAMNSNLSSIIQSNILHLNSSSSLLPVSCSTFKSGTCMLQSQRDQTTFSNLIMQLTSVDTVSPICIYLTSCGRLIQCFACHRTRSVHQP